MSIFDKLFCVSLVLFVLTAPVLPFIALWLYSVSEQLALTYLLSFVLWIVWYEKRRQDRNEG